MNDPIDPDVLAGFVTEVSDYLPAVRTAVTDFVADPTRADLLEEAARMLHCVKGAAGMLGYGVLSRMAERLEEHVCDLMSGLIPVGPQTDENYQAAVDLLAVATIGILDDQPGTDDDLDRVHELIDRSGVRPGAVSPVAGDLPELPDLYSDGLPSFDEDLPSFEEESPLEPVSVVSPGPAPAGPSEIDAELRDIFRAEAEDLFRAIHVLLPELDANRTAPDLVQGIRRAVHSLKGAAGAVGLKSVAKLSHRMEDLLDQLHDLGRAVTDEEVRLLVSTTDALESLTEGRDQDAAVARLLETYQTLLAEMPEAAAEPAEPVEATAPVETPAPEVEETPAAIPARTAERATAQASLRVPVERLDEMVRLLVELVTTRSTVSQRLGDFARFTDELRAGADRLRRVASRFDQQTMRDLPTGEKLAQGPLKNRIRGFLDGSAHGFDALEFDRYSDTHLLARELTESAIDVQTIASELAALFGDLDGLQTRQGRVIGEFEDRLFRLRMLPLSSLTDRLARAVRGAAESVGKLAGFRVNGGETALDKTILDAMADPLGHLVRNAVAHGIESPEERRALGKSPSGTVTLSAAREGNQVVLRVSDDGSGIRPDRLRATAVARGFLSSEEAAAAQTGDLHKLLFLPGFTTAEAVGEIAGRGVGLDAVQAQVIRLKGSLAIESRVGEGTTFVVRLPLTLAITRALMVEARQQTFALPLDAVMGIHRADLSQFAMVGDTRVFRQDNVVYPVIRLADALRLAGEDPPETRIPVVLVRTGGRDVAMIVDRLSGGREVVVKALGSHLGTTPGILGATLTGDGKVVLILNAADLAAAEAPAFRPLVPERRAKQPASRRVLIVDDSASVRRVVAGFVRRAGWEPVTANDGMEALELLAGGEQPAVIMSDVEMPRMDGYELLATLRADEHHRDIPVVMLTSRSHEKHRQKAVSLGAAAYLVKPYEEATLLRVLADVAGRRVLSEVTS